MKDPKGLTPSVSQEIASKLYPCVSKMCHEMGVTYLELGDDNIKFLYDGCMVTIQVKDDRQAKLVKVLKDGQLRYKAR